MIYSLAEQYVLENLHWSKGRLKNHYKKKYDTDYMEFVKQIQNLSEKNKVLFISNIEKIINNLIGKEEDKQFFLLKMIFSSLHHFFNFRI